MMVWHYTQLFRLCFHCGKDGDWRLLSEWDGKIQTVVTSKHLINGLLLRKVVTAQAG